MTDDQPEGYVTVRALIGRLMELADGLFDGLDTRTELGVCDGTDLQLVDNVDVNYWEFVSAEDAKTKEQFILVRAHVHPGKKAGKLLRGSAEHVDEELRELTEGSSGGEE